MNLARRIAEAPPSLRWQAGRVVTRLIYRRAFARIGRGTVIVSPRVLRGVDRIELGERCAVYPGAWLQCEPDGGPITIANDTYLGHGVHIHAGDPISIGSGCVVADAVLVTSTDHVRDADRSRSVKVGPIVIEDDVFIGQNAIVLGGVRIGAGATIGAGAVVTKNVPAGAVAVGVPARVRPTNA